MKDREHARCVAGAQIFEIDVGNQRARHVADPLDAENLVFEIHQPATIEAQFPKSPRAVQQIQMIQFDKRRLRAIHPVARFEQRLIEGAAVVSDHHAKLRQMRGDRVQRAGLFAIVAHEKLAHAKSLRRDAAHPDQKRAGSRAS